MSKADHTHVDKDLWKPALGEMVYSPCPKCMALLKVRAAMRLPAKWYKKPSKAFLRMFPPLARTPPT